MQSRTYILILLAGACVLVSYLFIAQPEVAVTATAGIALLVGNFAGIIAKQGEIEAKVDTAVEKVDVAIVTSENAIVASENNAVAISENTAKTDVIHGIVNARSTEMQMQIDQLNAMVAQLLTDKAVTAAEQKNIDANRPGLSE